MEENLIKACFLDKDGTIIIDKKYSIIKSELEFEEGVIDFLNYIQNKGYKIFILSNQSAISRGLYSVKDFENYMNWFIEKLFSYDIKVERFLYSPYHPDFPSEYDQKDRKPCDGMFKKIINDYNIDLEKSINIGDKITDIIPGINVGIKYNFLYKNNPL